MVRLKYTHYLGSSRVRREANSQVPATVRNTWNGGRTRTGYGTCPVCSARCALRKAAPHDFPIPNGTILMGAHRFGGGKSRDSIKCAAAGTVYTGEIEPVPVSS